MKIQIRRGVFETNSSSTHSLQICSKEEYEAWKAGDLYYLDGWENAGFFTESELINYAKNDKWYEGDGSLESIINHYKGEGELNSYDDYFEDEWLEVFEDTYTSKSGDEIIVFGKYGFDG